MSDGYDAMVLAPHPDDAELCCGGTILRMLGEGKRVALVDMTRGEKGTLGDPETRTAECADATQSLGVQERVNLELPDGELQDDLPTRKAIVEQIRRLRPKLLFAPHPIDIHPDHAATGSSARQAFFCAGLAKFDPQLGRAFRPAMLILFPGNDHVAPSFCVDISPFEDQKRAAIECYASQIQVEAPHFAKRLGPLERVTARDRYFGAEIGCRAAEPFVVEGPLRVTDLSALLEG